ncbi:MAG: hypothetical protein WC998_09885 [Candidatus Paceibacterota bacterium]|jgi:hypothetical protein
MPAPKGNRNNPNGRPPKNRALTAMLETALGKTRLYNEKSVSGKKILADLVSEVVITGRLKFPNDKTESIISVKDWIEFVKWLYIHIDGSVKTDIDVTSNGKTITTINVDILDEQDDEPDN